MKSIFLILVIFSSSVSFANTFTVEVGYFTSELTSNPTLSVEALPPGGEIQGVYDLGDYVGVPVVIGPVYSTVQFQLPIDLLSIFDEFAMFQEGEECGTQVLAVPDPLNPQSVVYASLFTPDCYSLRSYSFSVSAANVNQNVVVGTTNANKAAAIRRLLKKLGYADAFDICGDSSCSGGKECLPQKLFEQGHMSGIFVSYSEVDIMGGESGGNYITHKKTNAGSGPYQAKVNVRCACLDPNGDIE